jgi:hypothetical protein
MFGNLRVKNRAWARARARARARERLADAKLDRIAQVPTKLIKSRRTIE